MARVMQPALEQKRAQILGSKTREHESTQRESTKTTRKSREPSKENERKPKWADKRESKVM